MNLFDVDATPAEQRLLLYLSHPNHSLNRVEIAKSCGMHIGTISRLMCSLERRGLLRIDRQRPNHRGRKGYSAIEVFPAEESA